MLQTLYKFRPTARRSRRLQGVRFPPQARRSRHGPASGTGGGFLNDHRPAGSPGGFSFGGASPLSWSALNPISIHVCSGTRNRVTRRSRRSPSDVRDWVFSRNTVTNMAATKVTALTWAAIASSGYAI